MIKRIINGIKIIINEKESNAIYFPNDFARKLSNDSISTILDELYNVNEQMLPLTAMFEMTNNCNFKCPFCYIANVDKKSNKIKRFDEIKTVLGEMIDRGLLFCILTGGECLLHPDFEKVYLYLKKRGVLVSVLSNGSLIDESIIKMFKEYKPYKIEISLYGSCDDNFKNNTKQSKIGLSKILDNVLKLKNNEINVICKTPLNSVTENCFYEINNWCQSNNILYYYSSELFDTYDEKSNSKFIIKNSSLLKQLENEEFELFKLVNYEKGIKKYFDCKAGKYDLIVTYDWNIIPCFLLKNKNDFVFSLNDGFQNAYEQLIKRIMLYKEKRIEYCKGCKSYNICKECAATALVSHDKNICYKNNKQKRMVEAVIRNEQISNEKIGNRKINNR